MHCEIEFLPVGDASKAGDAIVIRYGSADAYELMIVDGGHQETGEQIVAHVRAHFGNHPISHVVLTHGDGDHAGGLRSVLTELDVRNFWFHAPWDAAQAALPYFSSKRWTLEGLQGHLFSEYDMLADLFRIATAKRIPVRAPLAGTPIGPFVVLSPSAQMYTMLLPQFDRTPAPDVGALQNVGWWIGKGPLQNNIGALLEKLGANAQKLWFKESWTRERLKDGGQTSASNEGSVVLYGLQTHQRILLTGDAGIIALTAAANAADAWRLPLGQFAFVQVPHHGSRRNVGPTILNRLVGPPVAEGTPTRFVAFASAPKDDAVHPRQMVVNAFKRRGGRVIATQGASKVHWGGFPARNGYSAAQDMPFLETVEDYD